MLSIIIPVHNAVDIVLKNLENLVPQLSEQDEIIVVDDKSHSPELMAGALEKYPVQFLQLKKTTSYNRGSAINLGVKNSKNSWIIELDQDKTPANMGYVESVSKRCLTSELSTVWFGHTLNHFSFEIKKKYIDKAGIATFNAVVGGNTCYHKSLFHQVQGYDSAYDGSKGFQDFDLYYRMQTTGCRFQYLESMLTNHIDSHEVTFETYKKNINRFYQRHGFLPEYN